MKLLLYQHINENIFLGMFVTNLFTEFRDEKFFLYFKFNMKIAEATEIVSGILDPDIL